MGGIQSIPLIQKPRPIPNPLIVKGAQYPPPVRCPEEVTLEDFEKQASSYLASFYVFLSGGA